MASPSNPKLTASPRQAFTFYAANGRVYASNVKQKLIDLGGLNEQGTGGRYLLDGNQQAGEGLSSPEAALRHIADHTRFLCPDGQFTALADLRETGNVRLDGAAGIEAIVDELQSGERIEDATV